jgi:putative membrane protein
MFYAHNIGWAGWLLMSIGMVAFWALVIWAIVVLVRGTAQPQPPRVDAKRPLDVLQSRLARGEISVDEYERLRDALIGRHEKTAA